MNKIQESEILIKNAKITAVKLNEGDKAVTKLIDDTRQKQVEVLKLKMVDQERLRMVVQL